ncbi:hypothetical protein NQ314_003412 [Rhamnusium bicolor]|uniref:Uncharacterized protein n=1 Tax=Rhamnusium bicolor TaxID=1586634 RepID=A0AAV8ZMV9_9CUCU|nr:hypothetical protein NQ314_003412 [Rhamnusium bicolor]
MSRSIRAETRSRAKDDIKKSYERYRQSSTLGKEMGYNWRYDYENIQVGSSDKHLAEDSNTCFSTVSDSQGPTDFSSSHMTFSEDSNSQGSEMVAVKRLKTD